MKLNQYVSKQIILGIILATYAITAYDLHAGAADEAFAQELIDKAERAKAQGYTLTQSQAHFSAPQAQKPVKKQLNLAKHRKIIEAALDKEIEFNKTHYVFYTAIPFARVTQDVTRELYKRTIGEKGALKDNAFQFIRYTYKDPIFNKYANVTDFIVEQVKKYGMINKTRNPDIHTILVSTNIAIFGNPTLTSESSYHFFGVQAQKWAEPKREFLEDSLKAFDYSTDFIDELLALSELIKTETADLFQIFVPKESINQIGYLSWTRGIPFDEEFISKLLKRTKLELAKISGQVIRDTIWNFIHKYENNDPQAINLSKIILENAPKGAYHLHPFLEEQYEKNPASLPHINFYQGRLLVTNDFLLNPESGISIFRYTTLDPLKEEEYKTKLTAIIERMEKEKQDRLGITVPEVTPEETKEIELLQQIKKRIEDARAAGRELTVPAIQIEQIIKNIMTPAA